MAAEQRRVIAETVSHAWALAENLRKQGFAIEDQHAQNWTLRKPRRRGDITVTIVIGRPAAPAAGTWGPPKGPRVG